MTPAEPVGTRWTTLDVVLPLAATAITVVALAGAVPGPRDIAPGWAGWLLAPALGLLLLLRRRMPTMTLVASVALVLTYYISGRPPIGLELLIAPACLSAAERGRLRACVVAGGAAVAVEYGYRATHTSGHVLSLLTVPLLTTVAVIAGAAAIGDAVRSRREQRRHAETERELLLAQREHLWRERTADERRAIAREIHDVLAHTLAVISQQASVAQESTDAAERGHALQLIKESTRSARHDLKDSLAVLRTAGGSEGRQPTPTLERIDELADRLRTDGLTVDLVLDPGVRTVPVAVASTGYRIVQEALTNAAKHADATHIEASVAITARGVELTVLDDGRSRLPWGPGSGLRGLRERVELLGGTATFGPTDDGGMVHAVLPLERGHR